MDDNPSYKIEKNVPLPEARRGKAGTYPFGDMEVGDSVLIEDRSQSSISGALTHYKYRWGKDFATRREGDGVRVWRTK